MRISQGQMSVEDLYRRQTDIDMEPWYQREKCWKPKDDSLLIDTILKNWDIPKIYLRVIRTGNYEVVDGHQRLLAIFNFVKPDGYRLVGDVDCSGKTFSDLDEGRRRNILRFRLQIAFIEDAGEDEVGQMFQRLQYGARLTSAEILNAIPGDMSNFVKRLAKNPFFPEKTYLSSARYAYLQAAAQMVHLELNGIASMKLGSLKKMYYAHKKLIKPWTIGEQVTSNIQIMHNMVPSRSDLLSNRAVVLSFYDLVSTLRKMDYKIDDHERELSNAFFEFLRELRMQLQMGIDATDSQLLEFRLYVIQSADSVKSLRMRRKILFESLGKKLNLPKKR